MTTSKINVFYFVYPFRIFFSLKKFALELNKILFRTDPKYNHHCLLHIVSSTKIQYIRAADCKQKLSPNLAPMSI